jgi:predicted DsbA family dithiol-disulfide isomerase
MGAATRIDVYSDTVCPWCFLGKRRFERALAERPQFEPRVNWRPYELNPDLPAEGVDRAWYLETRVGDKDRFLGAQALLESQGEAVGITFRFDLIERIPNTRRSHLLIAHAARTGLQSQVKDRLMSAYFEQGRDIGDPDELVRVGVEAGLAETETRNALILREGQDGIVAAERHAAALGITGVPTYIFDGQYTLSGAQDIDSMARVFDQVLDYSAARESAAASGRLAAS